MKTAVKWLAVAGALLLLMSFFLPVFSSSTSWWNAFQLARVQYLFVLYIVPVLTLALLALPLIPVNTVTHRKYILAAKSAIILLIIVVLLGSFVYLLLQSQVLNDTPVAGGRIGIGVLVGLLGIGILAFAIVAELVILWRDSKTPTIEENQGKPAEALPNQPQKKEAYLIGKKGEYEGQKILINVEDFLIGRSRENNLQLMDKKVSRLHIRIRYSQGDWFVQDQNSKIGILINGKNVKAARINSGDIIKIGDEEFNFHSD